MLDELAARNGAFKMREFVHTSVACLLKVITWHGSMLHLSNVWMHCCLLTFLCSSVFARSDLNIALTARTKVPRAMGFCTKARMLL